MTNTIYKSTNLFWTALVGTGRIIHDRKHTLYRADINMAILNEKNSPQWRSLFGKPTLLADKNHIV